MDNFVISDLANFTKILLSLWDLPFQFLLVYLDFLLIWHTFLYLTDLFDLFLGHVARSNCNCHGSYGHIKVEFFDSKTYLFFTKKFWFVSFCNYSLFQELLLLANLSIKILSSISDSKVDFYIYIYLLQPSWHISPFWSWWCVRYSKLSTAWFPSSWRAWGRKSYLPALFPCLYEFQFEVWCGRSSVSMHSGYAKVFMKGAVERLYRLIINLLSADFFCRFVFEFCWRKKKFAFYLDINSLDYGGWPMPYNSRLNRTPTIFMKELRACT